MIYPMNEQIEKLLESAYDPETGELLEEITEDDLQAQIEAMQIDFDEKITSLANAYLETNLEAECIAAEASALWKNQQEVSKRAKSKKNKGERYKRYIAWLLQGEKFKKDGRDISYCSSEGLVIEDREALVDWAKQNAPGLLKEPELRDDEVKKALKAGANIPFAYIEKRKNIQVK